MPWILSGTALTVGLSNAAYGDRGWKKVADGEEMLEHAINKSIESGESEDEFIQRLIKLLNTDSLTRVEGGGDLETYIAQLRNTIFVPPIGRQTSLHANEITPAAKAQMATVGAHDKEKLGVSGLYGTQKQTVVLANRSGHVRFFERTLHDGNGRPVPIGQGDLNFNFDIERSIPGLKAA